MTEKTITFSYTVGTARFSTDIDVDVKEWDEADSDERNEILTTAAMDDVEGMLDIEEDSIED